MHCTKRNRKHQALSHRTIQNADILLIVSHQKGIVMNQSSRNIANTSPVETWTFEQLWILEKYESASLPFV